MNRLLTAVCLTLALMSFPAHGQPADKAPLGSTVFDWAKLQARATGNGERRDVADLPTATLERFECHITTLNPGLMSHPPHQHAQEELIVLHEGELDVTIDGVTRRIGPGSLMFFAANDFHNVENVGDTPATYFVFNFATAVTRTVGKKSAAGMAVPGKLGSRVFDWAALEVKPTAKGSRRDVVDLPTTTLAGFECHITTINPGESPHAAHRHPDEEIILVREGSLDVAVNGATDRVGAGSILFFGSNDEHGLRNAGDSPAAYYVIRIATEKTPPPAGA